MKKFFKILMKILLVVVLVLSIGIAVFLFILSKNQNAPQKYWEKISTEGVIENKYNHLGDMKW